MENRRSTSNFSKAVNSERFSKPSDNTKPDVPNNRQFVREFLKKEDKFNSKNNKTTSEAKKKAPQNSKLQKYKKFQSKSNFNPRGKVAKSSENIVKPKIVSDLQITDGKHIGKYLQGSNSPKTRQTSRHLRESLFKILFKTVRGRRFLDLCAGIGTIGIEAVSRGSVVSTFVDRSAKMCSLIRKNLEICQIKKGHGEVFEMEAVPFLKQMSIRNRRWDVIYFDPASGANFEEVLEYFKRGIAIEKSGILVVEHHSEMFFPESLGVLKRWRVVTQGENSLSFYEKKR